ncbi:hypothetical protein [Bradyrhizobium sp.]|uniref:hypothetical protein n=1 Tax=Bradyrhizobium sp. TaxID=376 RepID=UPI002DDD25CD|nr:hypothetical protein [Bradyrhizobium sp.]HEV2153180.1 hypothetical protein [Bradyrhizobium sp.]
MKVLFAGPIAEAVVFDQAGPERALEILEAQGQDDFRKATEFVQLLSNMTFPLDQNDKSGKQKLIDELWEEAFELVDKLKDNIRSRAEAELEV